MHSSLAGLRLHPTGLKWDLLAALALLVREQRTIAVPTFTFTFCERGSYQGQQTESETGQLGKWLLELAGSVRTRHPIYSFAVVGPDSDEILAAQNSTTFGDDSTFALFERRAARIVMLGCDWRSCTQFHRYEEEHRVAYRRYKEFSGTVDYGEGPCQATARMFVRDLDLGAENDFTSAVDRLREQGGIAAHPLGDGRLEAAGCRDLARVCRELLHQDELAFVANRAAVERSLQRRASQRLSENCPWGGLPRPSFGIDGLGRPPHGRGTSLLSGIRTASRRSPLKIALLGHSNLELLRKAIVEQAGLFLPEQSVEVYSPAYGHTLTQILTDQSELNRFDATMTIFADRLQDLFQVASLDELRGRDDVEQCVDRYLSGLRKYAVCNSGRALVLKFTRAQASAWGAFDAVAEDGLAALVARCNARLEAAVADLPNVSLFDPWTAGWRPEAGPVCDPRLWFLGRFPFSQPFSCELARRCWQLMLAALGETVRLIVIDLDDTLWGGTLGEDGPEGIQIGGDYPGNAFAHFQSTLKQLSARGIALALCSKNDEHRALAAIRTLPTMILREEHLVAHRINWRPKWENVTEIVDELGLDHSHVLFVDNDPAERELVRRRLPRIKVLDLPADPAFFADALLECPYLGCLTLTAADRRRTENYRGQRRRSAHAGRFDGVDDGIASLASRVDVAPLAESNAARAEQLMAKTNQFNTTTRRYNRRQLQQLAENGDGVYLIGVEDRFSAREEVGVLVVGWHRPCPLSAEIDSFLLSCRMLGRGVETAVLCWLCNQARERSIDRLVGLINESDRNGPVRSLYAAHGFRALPDGRSWLLDVDQGRVELPPGMNLVDHRGFVEAEHA